MTQLATSAQTNCMHCYVIHITGQICIVTWRILTSLHALDCQQNKSATKKLTRPLHPLPIPNQHGDSVAMDFIGLLPLDDGFDCILSMTDRLNSDICIIPTHWRYLCRTTGTGVLQQLMARKRITAGYCFRPQQIVYFQVLESPTLTYGC